MHAPEPVSQLKTLTAVVYALQAVSFLFGVSAIAALVLNYLKLAEVRGTWLASHFRWQIRTFWFALLWSLLGALTAVLLVGYLILIVDIVWVVYRIARGWLALADGRAMYGPHNEP